MLKRVNGSSDMGSRNLFSGGKTLAGLLLLSWCLSAQALVVLQYHHVSEETPASTSVTPALFREHLEFLAENEFEIVTLVSVLEKLRAGEPLPDRAALITFDDAYESVYTEAFPLLKARKWPFTVFVNTGPLDRQARGFATWEQLREMVDAGAEIANHTVEHSFMQRLRDGESRREWRQRITAEVMDAEKRIAEETGHNFKALAYPYGEYDKAVKALLKELGFVAFAQNSGALDNHSDLLALPRYPFGGVFGAMDDFTTKAMSLPMGVTQAHWFSDWERREPLDDMVVRRGMKPVLELTLANPDLLPRVNCFASRQGAIETRIEDNRLLVRANEPLNPGRVQYNCTAGSNQRGRFHWYSQQWLVTGEDGQWLHEN